MPFSEVLLNVLFYVFALVALGGAWAVAVSRNIVRSAFALLAVLFAVAALYGFMRADFILAAQVLIYVGGILVLIIFAIMLTHRITDVNISNESAPGPVALFACLCVFATLALIVLTYRWERSSGVRTTAVQAPAGKDPVALEMAMAQGDGRTGVPPGEAVLDGYATLMVSARGAITAGTRARVAVFRGEERQGRWEWKEETRADGKLRPGEPGANRADIALSRLPPGRYRWSVQLLSLEGESDWVPHGAKGDGPEADFTAERGLTKSLGSAFMGPYLLPFEIVSVLLLAALLGAAYLARKEVRA